MNQELFPRTYAFYLLILCVTIFVMQTIFSYIAIPSFASSSDSNGKILFTRIQEDGKGYDIYSMNADGTDQVNLTNNPANDSIPGWSPDGTKIVFVSHRDEKPLAEYPVEIYVMDADGSNIVRLTDNADLDTQPIWSPDGSKIAFTSSRDGGAEIYAMNPDGSNVLRLTNNDAIDYPRSWSPDGSKIAFSSDMDSRPKTFNDGFAEIYVMDSDGTDQKKLTDNDFSAGPAWSPDGSKIAFTTNRDGNLDIYVINADGTNQMGLTNNDADDFQPSWSPDGSQIVFSSNRDGDDDIYIMDADGGNVVRLTNNDISDTLPSFRPSTDINFAFLLWQNSEYGLEIFYPSDWKVEPSDNGIVMFSAPKGSDSNSENVIIGLGEVAADVDLDAHNQQFLNILKSFDDFQLIESKDSTLAGMSAYRVVVSYSLFGTEIQTMATFTLKDQIVYGIIYTAEKATYDDFIVKVEKMVESFKITEGELPKQISGRYTNDHLELRIDLPEGWTGIETGQSAQTAFPFQNAVIVSPPIGSASSQKDTTLMMIFAGNITDILSGGYAANNPDMACETPPSAKITKINDEPNMKAIQAVVECESTEATAKIKMYMLGTEDNKLVYVMYSAGSAASYDENIAKFEESVKTLKLENAIDISDASNYASIGGYKVSTEEATVKGNAYDLEVVSNSAITNFSFDEEQKQISFEVEGAGGTIGSASVEVGTVLEGPYTVTVDGEVTDKGVMVIEDETTNQVSVEVSYTHSIHEIAITGTNVVPEFPLPLIGFIAATVIGIVSILGRTHRVFLGRRSTARWE